MASRKEWMLGLPGHTELVAREELARLIAGGQLRETDLVKKLGEPWRAAGEIAELAEFFRPPERGKSPGAAPRAHKAEEQGRPSARVPKAEPAAAARPVQPAPRREEPARKTTSDVPRAEPPLRRLRRAGTKPPPQETAEPGAEKEKAPPAEGERKAGPDSTKTEAPPPEPEEPPRPPPRPVPRLDPMAPKYYSPVDLLRSASHSFDPKKLIVTASVLLPLMVFWSLMDHMGGRAHVSGVRLGLFLVSTAGVVFGLAVAWTALSYVTRRQLEGVPYAIGDVIAYTIRNIATALIYPMLVLIPSLLALAALWVLGFVRDMSVGAAAALKILFVVPMFFALVAVAGVLSYQLASMYVPSAGAVEGEGLPGAARAAWDNVRRQPGRMVLHWLIVTVAVGVIMLVCLGLMEMAVRLPDWVFGVPSDPVSMKAYRRWQEFEWLFAVYRGLAYGLGLTLPVSLLSTLGMLSYMSLRHPVSAPLPGYAEETGGIEFGRPTPMEATQPAEMKSGQPDASDALPGADTRPVPPSGDVSDDSDEQPLA